MSLSNLIAKTFNLFGERVQFKIFGEKKYQSPFGVLMGAFSMLSVFGICFVFFLNFWAGQEFSLVSTEDGFLTPKNNLTNMPLIFNILDSNARVVNKDKTFEFELYMKYYDVIDTKLKFRSNKIEYEKCDKNKHFQNVNESLLNFDIPNYYCVNPGQEVTLNGQFGDTINGFSLFQITVLRCNPAKNECYSEDKIKERLAGVYFQFLTLDHQLRHSNVNNPIKQIFTYNTLSLDSKLYKRYMLYYKQLKYISDKGIIFKEPIQFDNFIFDSHDSEVFLTPPKVNDPRTFGILSFRNRRNVIIYERSFMKIQELFAKIGGIVKFIMIVAEIIVLFFTRRMMMFDLINSLDFPLTDFPFQEKKITSLQPIPPNNNSFDLKLNIPKLNKSKKFKPGLKNQICLYGCLKDKSKLKFHDMCLNVVNKVASLEFYLALAHDNFKLREFVYGDKLKKKDDKIENESYLDKLKKMTGSSIRFNN